MNNKLHEAFESIHATDEMKENTRTFVHSELSKKQRNSKTLLLRAFTYCAASVLVLAVCGIGGYGLYTTPVSYISVDVNPSVELGLNSFDRIVSITAYNDDGALVLQNLNLKNKPYTEAVELLLADETFLSYLAEDALLSFTVVSDNEETLLAGIKQCAGYTETNAECHSAGAETVNEAHHNGLSFGKYQAYLELSQYDPSMTAKDCQHLSMQELRDRISQFTDSENTLDSNGQEQDLHHGGDGNGQGNGHHGCKDTHW